MHDKLHTKTKEACSSAASQTEPVPGDSNGLQGHICAKKRALAWSMCDIGSPVWWEEWDSIEGPRVTGASFLQGEFPESELLESRTPRLLLVSGLAT